MLIIEQLDFKLHYVKENVCILSENKELKKQIRLSLKQKRINHIHKVKPYLIRIRKEYEFKPEYKQELSFSERLDKTVVNVKNKIRLINSEIQDKILFELKKENNLSVYDLMNRLNTPKTTLNDNLYSLEHEVKVFRIRVSSGKRGRPITKWNLI